MICTHFKGEAVESYIYIYIDIYISTHTHTHNVTKSGVGKRGLLF